MCPRNPRITGLCARNDWSYTRYCDDITISGQGRMDGLADVISKIVEDEGFRLNVRKTRVLHRNGRQTVTGLVVNDKMNICRHRRKIWRAIFHQAALEPEKYLHRHCELAGYVAFLRMISPDTAALHRYENVISKLRSAATAQNHSQRA